MEWKDPVRNLSTRDVFLSDDATLGEWTRGVASMVNIISLFFETVLALSIANIVIFRDRIGPKIVSTHSAPPPARATTMLMVVSRISSSVEPAIDTVSCRF